MLELSLATPPRPHEARVATGAPEVRRALDLDEVPPLIERLSLRIDGVFQAAQARRLERQLSVLEGVLEARINQSFNSLTLSLCGSPHDRAWWVAWLELRGVFAAPMSKVSAREVRKEERRRLRYVAWRSVALATVGLTLGAARAWLPGLNLQLRAMLLDSQALVTAALVLWGATPAWLGTLGSLANARRAPDALPFVAGLGLFLAGLGQFFAAEEPYFEAALLTLGVTTWARYRLSDLGRRARGDLEELQRRLTGDVRTVRREGVFRVHGDAVVPGDLILCHAGDVVPTDGVAVEGEGVLDGVDILGAPDRLNVQLNADGPTQVWAGMRVLSGRVAVRTACAPAASSLARRLERLQRLGDEDPWLAARTLFEVRLLSWGAVAAAALAAAFTLALSSWTTATPLGGFSACLVAAVPLLAVKLRDPRWPRVLLAAARGGVLFRDPESLERLATVGDAVLEAAGVLTSREHRVARFEAIGMELQPGLALALALCEESAVPWARAVEQHARQALEDVNATPQLAAREDRGDAGLRGVLADGRVVALGTMRLAAELGVSVERGSVPPETLCRYLVVDGALAAVLGLTIEPVLQKGARDLVVALGKEHLRLAFVTPEDAAHARFVASAVGIGRFEAQRDLSAAALALPGALGTALLFDGWRTVPAGPPGVVPVCIGEGGRDLDEVPVQVVSGDLGGAVRAFRIARRLVLGTRRGSLALAAYHLVIWICAACGWMGPTEAAASAALLTVIALWR